jgi:hypothetical protein
MSVPPIATFFGFGRVKQDARHVWIKSYEW